MFATTIGEFTVRCHPEALPSIYASYVQRARLSEQFGLDEVEGDPCFVGVERGGRDWPFLVVALRYTGAAGGMHPGALIVPETGTLFLGAGARLLAYDLRTPRRLWEDRTELGFWGWDRQGDMVLMSAELELAGYDLDARRRWAVPVEPPWGYTVDRGVLTLDVMGTESTFALRDGPGESRAPVT